MQWNERSQGNIINRCWLDLPRLHVKTRGPWLDCSLWSSVQKGSYFSLSDRSLFLFFASLLLSKELITYAVYSNCADLCQGEKERDRRGERENGAYLVFYKINRLSWYNASFGASDLLACTFDLFLWSTCMQLLCGCYEKKNSMWFSMKKISKNSCNSKYVYSQLRETDESDSNSNL